MPKEEIITTPSIVIIVAIAKTHVTATKPKRLFLAAGYISRGINGSHGPKINTVKSIHGVIFFDTTLSWMCKCSLV
jgi:hypothetical protein